MKLNLFEGLDKTTIRIALLGLLIQLITAYFSIGYNHADEHWQLLEFANFKLGLSPSQQLPWEYAAKSRSCIQPLIAYVFGKIMLVTNMYDPHILAFILRLIGSFAAWFCSILMLQHAKKYFPIPKQIHMVALVAFFTWFLPYIHTRFSAENWGGILFFFGFIWTLNTLESPSEKQRWIGKLGIGCLFGFAFLCRFQIVFAALGFGVWLLIIQRVSIWWLVPICLGGLTIVGAGFVIDYWYYGVWISSAYNYYDAQIVQNVAANWGETPWWDYFRLFLESGAPPVSLVLLIFILLSVVASPANPYAWVMVIFVVGHMLVGHKEDRFLFPMAYFMPVMTVLWVNNARINTFFNSLSPLIKKPTWFLVLLVNTLLLVTIMFFKPANESVPFYKYVYYHTEGKKVTILTWDADPYKFSGLENNFYKPRQIETIKITSIDEATTYLSNHPQEKVYLFDNHFILPNELKSVDLSSKIAYRTVPEWLLNFNINNWLSRTRIWNLYEIEKSKK